MDPLLELADAMTVLAPSQPALCPNPGTQQHGAATASSPGAEEDPEDDPLLSLAAAVGSTPAAAAAVTQQQDTPKPEAAARPCSQLQRTPGALTATAPPVEAPAAPSSSTVEAAGVVAAKRGRAWLSSATPAATAAQDQLRAASGAHASTSGNTSSSGVQHYIETLTGIKVSTGTLWMCLGLQQFAPEAATAGTIHVDMLCVATHVPALSSTPNLDLHLHTQPKLPCLLPWHVTRSRTPWCVGCGYGSR